MTARLDGEVIRLEGDCGVDDAEPLAALLARARRPVDLSRARSLHAAVVQALLAFAPALVGAPDDPFLRDVLAPTLQRAMVARA